MERQRMTAALPSVYQDIEARLLYIERTLSILSGIIIITSLGMLLAAIWRKTNHRS
jgi:hypothetical protein